MQFGMSNEFYVPTLYHAKRFLCINNNVNFVDNKLILWSNFCYVHDENILNFDIVYQKET